jgi:hypothetical protein
LRKRTCLLGRTFHKCGHILIIMFYMQIIHLHQRRIQYLSRHLYTWWLHPDVNFIVLKWMLSA